MANRAADSYRIYEERDEKLVSFKDSKQYRRLSRFLKPCAPNSTKAVPPSTTPLLSDVLPHTLHQWPSTTTGLFPGFKKPQKKWEAWIDRLAGKYCTIWNQAGICDAIMSSKFEVKFNTDLVLGLVEYWSPESNTFVFDWGEATVTLEDVMVVGGFSVLGRSVTRPVDGVLLGAVKEMENKKLELQRTPAKKAYHFNWMSHFMKLQDYKYEHVAFLSLWLARFVFPCLPEESLGKHVFPIAVLLSQGTKVALAPAILAGLYRDLSDLRSQVLKGEEMMSVSSPFQLLQLWALERFSGVVKGAPKRLEPGEPRAARWSKVNCDIGLVNVRRAVNLAENFRPRPYAADMINWRHGSYYGAKKAVFYDKTTDPNLLSYVKCLSCAELVGVDGSQVKYLPHRVAMQFGVDQDLPVDPAECSGLGSSNVRFFVPAWFYEPSVTARYVYWWGKCKKDRADAIKDDVIKAVKMIQEKSHHHSVEKKNLKMQKASTKALTESGGDMNLPCVVPAVRRKSTAQFPKKVMKDLSEDHNDGGNTLPLKQRGLMEKRPACLSNASAIRQSTNENVKKRKLALSTEECPAKKRNTSEYTKNLRMLATKGMKSSGIGNVQTTVRINSEPQVVIKVSVLGSANGGKRAMAKGSVKKPMEVDAYKVKQSKTCAAKGGKVMGERFEKKPMEANCCKVKQCVRGSGKEVKGTMVNTRTKNQKDGGFRNWRKF